MTIQLDVTKRQLSFIIAAMSRDLRTDDVMEIIRGHENSWSSKALRMREFAERCELLAMLDRTFNATTEDNDE